MFAIPVIKMPRPVAVLLGGSGYAQPSQRMPTVPALLKPRPHVSERAGSASEPRTVGG
jgi:hypothetical protein